MRTDLRERLVALGRDQLIVCGVYGHIGCLMTATDAFMHEVQPFLVADAIADFSAEDHRMAIAWAAKRCAAVTTTDRVFAEVEPAPVDRELLRAEVAAVLDDPPVPLHDDHDLIDLGLDSLTLLDLVAGWRTRGVVIDFEQLVEREPTLGAWWELLEG